MAGLPIGSPSRTTAGTRSAPRSWSAGPDPCRGASRTRRAARSPPPGRPTRSARSASSCGRASRGAAGRVSHLRIDPEIEIDGPLDPDGATTRALAAAGWRPAPPIQPASTRVIDLRADEAALWGDLRKKWRQYVNKARSGGVTSWRRTGIACTSSIASTATRPTGRGSSSAPSRRTATSGTRSDRQDAPACCSPRRPNGEPVATLFLVRCGPRVVEPYGGMTAAGADSRANYLLKWEAIRSSREQGATSYDLWGLATGGIAHFKTGFGGREVRYIGAYDLTLDPMGRAVYENAVKARVWWARRRHGLAGSASASAYQGAE